MNIVEKTIKSPICLLGRKAHRFVFKIANMKSSVKISTLDNAPINAKSLLGLLSLRVNEGDLIRIACHCENKKIAEQELKDVIKIIKELAVSDNE